jgi:nucleolar protein 56
MYTEKEIQEIINYTKENVIKKLESADQKIINLSQIIDKLQIKINELFELLKIITDQEYPILDQDLTIKEYCKFYNQQEKNETKLNEFKKIGINLDKNLKEITISFSKNILDLIEIKEKIEKEMDYLLKEHYVNLYSLATPKIAFKMIEITGSVQRLASFPASTVQLLGSEKSFFKALKFNKKTPKYGVLYNHPLIINVSFKNKARLARTIAAKISIAVKADLNKKEIYPELLEKINDKIRNLK